MANKRSENDKLRAELALLQARIDGYYSCSNKQVYDHLTDLAARTAYLEMLTNALRTKHHKDLQRKAKREASNR